jgi:hypothetical protein
MRILRADRRAGLSVIVSETKDTLPHQVYEWSPVIRKPEAPYGTSWTNS